MSALHTAEIDFLREIKRTPMTVDEALKIDFGTRFDAIDVINKFLSLGLLDYDSKTGNFVYANSDADQQK